MDNYINVLSIAGSDPCGCAGMQADILTGNACGAHVATAVTALTVQNTHRVAAVNAAKPEIVKQQIEIIASDIPIHAVKIGLLPSVEIAHVVADCIHRFKFANIVIDPIGVATAGRVESGECFSSLEGIIILLPLATIITPNLNEATLLLGESIHDSPIYDIAYQLHCKFGPKAVIVTNGDQSNDTVRDGFYCSISGEYGEFLGSKIDSHNTHGSGCAFSTAIASFLAKGCNPISAIAHAERLIHQLIAEGRNVSFGKGNYGPLGFYSHLKIK